VKVRVIEQFSTAKGVIPEGTIINIPETLFDRLQGKVVRISPADTRKPLSEGRRETLALVADGILEQTVIDIQTGGVWNHTPDVTAIEDEINRLHRALLEGAAQLETFRQAVEQWKTTGTQTRH
jgi:hypothetical protein